MAHDKPYMVMITQSGLGVVRVEACLQHKALPVR